MVSIYVYLLDTMADWEMGHVMAELGSKRYFKKDAPEISIKKVSLTKEPVCTMGGFQILPDCLLEEMELGKDSMLLLPGANTWEDARHRAIVEKAEELLGAGGVVCAICGATVALANQGLLDHTVHTSNGVGFLDMMAPTYAGKSFYVDEPSVVGERLITASATGALDWAKNILEYLGVFRQETMEAWYAYFSTGEAQHFFALMQSLQ